MLLDLLALVVWGFVSFGFGIMLYALFMGGKTR